MIKSTQRFRSLLKITVAPHFFQLEGGLKCRLGREVTHRAFQTVGEALQILILHVVDGEVYSLHLLGKIVQEQTRQLT